MELVGLNNLRRDSTSLLANEVLSIIFEFLDTFFDVVERPVGVGLGRRGGLGVPAPRQLLDGGDVDDVDDNDADDVDDNADDDADDH